MGAGTTRSFPVPTGSCSIPAGVTAYSFNVTVVPKATLQYLTIWPTGFTQPSVSTLNSYNGQVVANAAIVPAGNGGAVSVYVTDSTDVIIDINGYFSVQTDSTNGSTKFGVGALASDSGSGSNTGLGFNALTANTTGFGNSSFGTIALQSNTTGNGDTAMGDGALSENTTASDNTAFGYAALNDTVTGSENTAIGEASLVHATGSDNTAVGQASLYSSTTGNSNTAFGYQAGLSITTGSNNIDIASQGASGDSGVIRIGSAGAQTQAFIAGITGIPVSGAAVIVSSSGQLGVQASSIKYKEDVRDLGDDDTALMELRPVSFRYIGTSSNQFGLIAEEVAKVYPDLVARDATGQAMSVQYHELPALLLHEIQRQHKRIQAQDETIGRLEKRLADLEMALKK